MKWMAWIQLNPPSITRYWLIKPDAGLTINGTRATSSFNWRETEYPFQNTIMASCIYLCVAMFLDREMKWNVFELWREEKWWNYSGEKRDRRTGTCSSKEQQKIPFCTLVSRVMNDIEYCCACCATGCIDLKEGSCLNSSLLIPSTGFCWFVCYFTYYFY